MTTPTATEPTAMQDEPTPPVHPCPGARAAVTCAGHSGSCGSGMRRIAERRGQTHPVDSFQDECLSR